MDIKKCQKKKNWREKSFKYSLKDEIPRLTGQRRKAGVTNSSIILGPIDFFFCSFIFSLFYILLYVSVCLSLSLLLYHRENADVRDDVSERRRSF